MKDLREKDSYILNFCHVQFTASNIHIEFKFIKCKCHSWNRKMGIYV